LTGIGARPSVPVSPVAPPVLEVRDLSKSYGPVAALTSVSFVIYPGEVLALLGDNGAGKSTLVRCVSGMTTPDSGAILVNNKIASISSPHVARELGIETVHQDLMLVGSLNVAANMFLGRELRTRVPVLRQLGWLDKVSMRRETTTIVERLHIRIPSINAPVEVLSGGQRQSVAVGRAVSWGRQLVVMDEPVAALGVEQTRQALELIGHLRSNGIAVLLITHNMQHVMQVCDRAVVLWHGTKVGDVRIRDVAARDLVDLITGVTAPQEQREIVELVSGEAVVPDDEAGASSQP
jgi:simple sugar transport system ATP-binding protein